MSKAVDDDNRPRGRPFKSFREREAMKKRIAETAKNMFQTEGYAKVSMRRLAKEVGCSPMTLYQYYDGKIAVLQTLWAFVFADIFDQLNEQLEHVSDPKDRLRVISTIYVRYWIAHEDHYRLVFMTEGVTQPDVTTFIGTPEIEACVSILAATAMAAMAAPSSDHMVKVKVDLLISTLHGIALNAITISGYPWSNVEEMVALFVEEIV